MGIKNCFLGGRTGRPIEYTDGKPLPVFTPGKGLGVRENARERTSGKHREICEMFFRIIFANMNECLCCQGVFIVSI